MLSLWLGTQVRYGAVSHDAMCLCLAARSEKASAWFRSPAARVRSPAAPVSDSCYSTQIGTSVIRLVRKECGRDLTVKAKKQRKGKAEECQRNLSVSDRFQFEALLLKAQLNALELPRCRTWEETAQWEVHGSGLGYGLDAKECKGYNGHAQSGIRRKVSPSGSVIMIILRCCL